MLAPLFDAVDLVDTIKREPHSPRLFMFDPDGQVRLVEEDALHIDGVRTPCHDGTAAPR